MDFSFIIIENGKSREFEDICGKIFKYFLIFFLVFSRDFLDFIVFGSCKN